MDLFTYDPLAIGTKGFVFIGDKLLVYRRDTNTQDHPLFLDLPGGGHEKNETPFDTFRRELFEEFHLIIEPRHITYWRMYRGVKDPGARSYYLAATLPASAVDEIVFGNEGTEYMLMSIEEFINHGDAWPVVQERARDYLAATSWQAGSEL